MIRECRPSDASRICQIYNQPIGIHSVLAGIALPNAPSVTLHEKLGFEQVAHFRETGRKFKRWIDVAYWERNL